MEFLDEASKSFYPFNAQEEIRSINIGGKTFLLKNNFLLDMFICYNGNVYLKTIEKTFSVIICKFADFDTKEIVSQATIPLSEIYAPIRLNLEGAKGCCIFGEGIKDINFFGEIEFNKNKTMLLNRVIKKDADKVKSIIEGNSGEQYTKNVKFYEGYNISLKKNNNKISVVASPGNGLGFFCGNLEHEDCEGCLRTINGIHPDEQNMFKIKTEKHVTHENFPDINKIIIGTQIPIERLECQREGTKGKKGPTGPRGPAGSSGNNAPDVCVTCLECNVCNTCENQCGVCNNAENCPQCESCNTAENIRT
jgi:hypothetical protein